MIKRPSPKELYERLRQAREILDDGRIYLVDDEPIIADTRRVWKTTLSQAVQKCLDARRANPEE